MNQLHKAKMLLQQALSATVTSDSNPHLSEARKHMKQAVQNLEHITENQIRKKRSSPAEQWQNQIGVAKIATSLVSQESHMRSFKQLEAMIAQEQSKLDELEKQTAQKDAEAYDSLFND